MSRSLPRSLHCIMSVAGHGDRDETAPNERDPIKISEDMKNDPRRQIIQAIKKIQPQTGKHFKDIAIPEVLFQQARTVAWHEEGDRRFKKVPVYELMVSHIRHKGGADCETLTKSRSVLEGWKAASIALFRYALNLQLAPKRPEFKKMKVRIIVYHPLQIFTQFSLSHSSPPHSMCTTSLATCTRQREYCL